MISLVVPCYNEEENIRPMYELIVETFKDYKDKYEILFVNDGSNDNTIERLREIVNSTKEEVRVIDFSRNFGKESAIYAGLKESKGDFVALIDGDLQQDPKYVLEAVNFLKENSYFDCVTYYQNVRRESFIMKFFKKNFYRIINRVSETRFTMDASDFRILRRNMVNAVLELQEHYRFSKGIFSWVGFHNQEFPYEVKDRNSGSSKWGFRKLFKYAFDGIIAFTTVPLKFSTYVGAIASIFSFVYLLVVIIQKLFFGISIPGYPTIITLMLFLGGLELLSLGIMGAYIGRNYIETKKRPIYVARERLSSKDKK